MKINITIEKDLGGRTDTAARFRAKLAVGGKKLFSSTRAAGSVTIAKRDAEDLLGPLEWRDVSQPGSEIRAVAEIELD